MWNEAGDGEYIYELIVYTLPTIVNVTQFQPIVNVIETRNFIIDCPAVGTPAPKVRNSIFNIHWISFASKISNCVILSRFNGSMDPKSLQRMQLYPFKMLMHPIEVILCAQQQMNMEQQTFHFD